MLYGIVCLSMDFIPSGADDPCGTGAGRIDPASVKIESGTSEEGSGEEP